MNGTYNPILSVEEIPRLTLFQPRPSPEPGIALALFQEGQPVVVLWPGDRLTAGEVRWGKYKKFYKVDVGEHSFTFNSVLPCRSDAFDFHAEVQVSCSVIDPAFIVHNKVTDARRVLEPLIVSTMREVSRHYDVEESEAAEREVALAVQRAKYNVGFALKRVVVRLRLEEDARNYIRQLRQYDRAKVLTDKEAELQKQRDLIEIERLRTKMEFYGPLIEQGQWQLLAVQLSNRPEDVAGIIHMLHQQRQLEMKHQLEALKIMLEEDAIEGFQLEETGKRVLRRLVDSLGTLDVKAITGPQEAESEAGE